jgi:hypothetical protein
MEKGKVLTIKGMVAFHEKVLLEIFVMGEKDGWKFCSHIKIFITIFR